nr:hypothetical protein [Tanacetum cinerariifolium]
EGSNSGESGSSSRPRKALASSKSRKSLSPNGVSIGEVVETIGSLEGVGLPLAISLNKENYVPLSSRLLRNQVIQIAIQNLRIQNVGNQNGQMVVPGTNQNPYGNGNLVAAHAEADLNEIEEVNVNCILMANLQQASTSGTQTDKAPIYDSDGSSEVHYYEDCCDNEVKSTIVTLQRVVKQRIAIDTHNWSSSAHQELHKIVKDDIFPIVNQVDARVQNFEIQFLKEAAKFVGDFKSLAKEADESLAKYKALELEIERFLRAVVNQDIMFVVQNNSVDETSNL